jgi:hypothetical protein
MPLLCIVDVWARMRGSPVELEDWHNIAGMVWDFAHGSKPFTDDRVRTCLKEIGLDRSYRKETLRSDGLT